MNKRIFKILLVTVLFLVIAIGSYSVFAQSQARSAFPAFGGSSRSGPLQTKADQMRYNHKTGWTEAIGNVVVKKGNEEVRAKYVRFHRKTEAFEATGDVIFMRDGKVVSRAPKLSGNMKTGKIVAPGLVLNSEPFYLKASKAEKNTDGTYGLRKARVTTCTNKFNCAHYHVRARKLIVSPGNYMNSYGVSWFLGPVPIFYFPYWHRNLKEDVEFTFYPGYESRWGGFVLGSYRFPMGDIFKGETHVDYRSKRGFGFGQDVKWRDPSVGDGEVSVYYVDDEDPTSGYEARKKKDIDSSRYRIRFDQNWDITDRDYVFINAEYLSDRYVRKDFFEREYRKSIQPENYISYTHRENKYSVNALLQGRLNDFYTTVSRTPEGSIDIMRQPLLGDTFYYEGRTAAAFLEKMWDENVKRKEDYSSMRIDSSHLVYRPRKYFGFLNLVPRAGYRGTYYSDTPDVVTGSTNVTSSTVTSNVVVGGVTSVVSSVVEETNSLTTVSSKGAGLRSRLELGVEASYKAFKTWNNVGDGLRHIVEPYTDYTFVPEPSFTTNELYQFDTVDALDENHSIKIGVRNKFQTKRDGGVFDLVDIDVYTRYSFDRSELENLWLDAELRPAEWLAIDFDAVYDFERAVLDRFNSQFVVSRTDSWKAQLEHRYWHDVGNLLFGRLVLYPNKKWTLGSYTRYELDDSRLQEQTGYIQRNFDCMVIRTGVGMLPGYTTASGEDVEDEWKFLIQFWLTAFPDVSIEGS